jgi:hypothetical protein
MGLGAEPAALNSLHGVTCGAALTVWLCDCVIAWPCAHV